MEKMKVDELKKIAKELNIPRYYEMVKETLIK